jgi:hypothetical protein
MFLIRMDSRLSEVYNKRAALLTMIPGGFGGIPMNVHEGGEPDVSTPSMGRLPKLPNTHIQWVPDGRQLSAMREALVHWYERNPAETATTFSGVLGAGKLNAEFTSVKKSDLPVRNFNIINSEKYPDKPVLWETSIGADARWFGRSDHIRYTR